MTTTEERLSHLEGAYQHLATKADIGEVRVEIADLKVAIANLEAQLIRWMVGLMVGSIAAASSIALLVQRTARLSVNAPIMPARKTIPAHGDSVRARLGKSGSPNSCKIPPGLPTDYL